LQVLIAIGARRPHHRGSSRSATSIRAPRLTQTAAHSPLAASRAGSDAATWPRVCPIGRHMAITARRPGRCGPYRLCSCLKRQSRRAMALQAGQNGGLWGQETRTLHWHFLFLRKLTQPLPSLAGMQKMSCFNGKVSFYQRRLGEWRSDFFQFTP
jgi:hypothetical protein